MKPKNKSSHVRGNLSDKSIPKSSSLHHDQAQPVAEPAPPMDGRKPIPAGTDEFEKFLVATDTNGGESFAPVIS